MKTTPPSRPSQSPELSRRPEAIRGTKTIPEPVQPPGIGLLRVLLRSDQKHVVYDPDLPLGRRTAFVGTYDECCLEAARPDRRDLASELITFEPSVAPEASPGDRFSARGHMWEIVYVDAHGSPVATRLG